MKVSTVTLDPKRAQKLLDNRAANRPLDEKYALRLCGAIRAKKWELNGETIKINTKGQLEDGQHRCLAVVLSGQSIRTALATELPADNGIFDTIDTGKRRSLAHVFARGEEQNYAMLAAAVGWLWRWETDRISSFQSPRNDQAIDVLERHPKLRESCQAAHASRKVMAPGLAAFLHYLFSASDPVIAGWFFEALGSGENLSKTSLKTSAILKLRETLVSDRDKRCKRHAYAIIALTIKAWNCTKKRVVCKALRWSVDEAFPEVE